MLCPGELELAVQGLLYGMSRLTFLVLFFYHDFQVTSLFLLY
jgi:hypothetical protein